MDQGRAVCVARDLAMHYDCHQASLAMARSAEEEAES
jgi:hypothetical protein